MIRTTAKTGPRTGQPLWRCSDFSCPTLINIEDGDATPVAPRAGESAQSRYEFERAAYLERVKRGAVLLTAGAVIAGLSAFFAGAMVGDIRIAAAVALVVVI